MTCDLDQDKLHAYVDESLPQGEREATADHLHTCASCAAEALALIQMKRTTRAAAAGLTLTPGFSLRPEFRRQVESSVQRSSRPFWNQARLPWLLAAAFALLIVVTSAVLVARRSVRSQGLAEAVDLHVATLASVNPVDVVSTDRHTVKPWFQGKLPFTFNLPELQGSNYKLLGGKLAYVRQAPAAQLLYQVNKHELSVFIVQEERGEASSSAAVVSSKVKGFSAESWSSGGLSYIVLSDAGSGDVHALGELLRTAR